MATKLALAVFIVASVGNAVLSLSGADDPKPFPIDYSRPYEVAK